MKMLRIESMPRGYLAQNQLSRLKSEKVHLEATVVTTMSTEKRPFSWLWNESEERALLVNRLTGTIFDPSTGNSINGIVRILEAPIEAPTDMQPSTYRSDMLPNGIYATAD